MTSNRRVAILLFLIVLAAFALKVGLGLSMNRVSDEVVRGNQVYGEAATNILEGRGYYWEWYFGLGERWANRPPGYALAIAGIRTVVGSSAVALILVQALFGALTAIPVFLLGRRMFGAVPGLIAAALTALHPYYVVNDSALSENGLYTHLLAWSVYGFYRLAERPSLPTGILAGVISAAAGMVRVTWFASLPFVCLWVLLRTTARRKAFVILALVTTPVVIGCCLPWLFRNHDRFGKFAMAVDTGRALWNGNNPDTLSRYPEESIDLSEAKAWHALSKERREELRNAPDEAAADAIFMTMAKEHITADLRATIDRSLVKVWAFFSPFVNPGPAGRIKFLSHLIGYVICVILVIVAIVLCPGRWRDLLLGVALILGGVLVAAVFWGQTRFRVPTDWFFLIWASVPLARLFGTSSDDISQPNHDRKEMPHR